MGRMIERVASAILLSWGWRANGTAFLAGLAVSFAHAPFDFWPLAFAGFTVLALLMDGAAADGALRTGSARFLRGFVRGWFFGFGFFLGGLWWVSGAFFVDGGLLLLLMPPAAAALPAGLALFTGFGAGLALMMWGGGPARLFALGFGIALSEWMRGTLFTGFPWNVHGMAAMPDPVGMQTASLIGLYGVTALAVPVFAAPLLLMRIDVQPRRVANALTGVLVLALAGAHLGYGIWRTGAHPVDDLAVQDDVAIRIVQPNIPQAEKWLPEKEQENFARFLSLSNRATSPDTIGVESFSHLIWPETALPFILTRRPDAIAAIADLLPQETTLITGAVRVETPAEPAGPVFATNSVYVLNGAGEIIGAHDKVRLVPFGEYIPLLDVLALAVEPPQAWREFGFDAGATRTLFSQPGTPAFLPLICYEILFPTLANSLEERPQWIVNLTNDAWFGHTPGPYQHLRQAQVRAAEEGLPVVRAANTGISALIDPYGRIVRSLPLGEEGVLDHGLPQPLTPTLFSRIGNLGFWVILGLFLILCRVGARQR